MSGKLYLIPNTLGDVAPLETMPISIKKINIKKKKPKIIFKYLMNLKIYIFMIFQKMILIRLTALYCNLR